MTKIVTDILSILVLLGDIAIVLYVVLWAINKTQDFVSLRRFVDHITQWVQKHAAIILFIIPTIAMLASLYYSKIAGWEPCELCWYQRIAMYPIVVLAGTALWRNTKNVVTYIIPLATIGAVISTIHYIEQINVTIAHRNPLFTCVADSISCGTVYTFHFGYITIPMMALTGFVLILLIARVGRTK